MSAAGAVTLLGKAPARADFIRINHGGDGALALDEWLQRNLEELVLGGQRAAPAARFAFVPQGGREALVGLLAPSRDKAGRAFPIALFSTVPVTLAMQRPFVLPLACAPLVAEAHALFDTLPALDYEALKARVAAIAAPAQAAYDAAHGAAVEQLDLAVPAAWVERLFGESPAGTAESALHELAQAVTDPAPKPVVLECPVQDDVDALFWLALAGRGGKVPVSFFWTEAVAPARSRLLLCLKPPPPQTLLHLANPKPQAGRLLVLSQPGPHPAPAEARQKLDKLAESRSLAAFLGLTG